VSSLTSLSDYQPDERCVVLEPQQFFVRFLWLRFAPLLFAS
jgi:hypothetical protein